MTRDDIRRLETLLINGSSACHRVGLRLMHGSQSVTTRSANGATLYEDLQALVTDYADLQRAVAALAQCVVRGRPVESVTT